MLPCRLIHRHSTNKETAGTCSLNNAILLFRVVLINEFLPKQVIWTHILLKLKILYKNLIYLQLNVLSEYIVINSKSFYLINRWRIIIMGLLRKSIFFMFLLYIISGLLLRCGSPVNELKNYKGNQAPVITKITSNSPGSNELLPNMEIKIEAAVYDPDENPLSYEFSSEKIGSFRETKKTATGCEVIYILPASFSSRENILVTLKVTDSKGLAAIKTLDVGSGKTGPTLYEESQVSSYLTATGSSTIRWQADDSGYYQINISDSERECTINSSLPFSLYSENEWIETDFTGPLADQADGNQLTYGENTVCIIVVDALGQEGSIKKKIIVDANPPATSADLEYDHISDTANLVLLCADNSGITESGCEKIIYTMTTDGTNPPDPEFGAQGNILTGKPYEAPIEIVKNRLNRIKYRAMDIAGNREKVNFHETDFTLAVPDDTTDYIAPYIERFYPSGGNVDYADGVNIDIIFSENIVESTLPATLNIFEEGSTTSIPNTLISYDSEGSVAKYYIGTQNLKKYTQYNIIIPNTITDAFNNEITGTFGYTFRTLSFSDPRIINYSVDQCSDKMNIRLFYDRTMDTSDMNDGSLIKVTHEYTEYGSGPNLYPSEICSTYHPTTVNMACYGGCVIYNSCETQECESNCAIMCTEPAWTEYYDPCYVYGDYNYSETFYLPFKYGISGDETFVFESTVNFSASSTNRERLYIGGAYYPDAVQLHPAIDLNGMSSSQFSLIYANDTDTYPDIPDFTSNTCP